MFPLIITSAGFTAPECPKCFRSMSSCVIPNKKKKIRAVVAGQRSLSESRLVNKTKMHLMQNINSESLEYEDTLYFDLQPNPMACTLGSVFMEWKRTLQGTYF